MMSKNINKYVYIVVSFAAIWSLIGCKKDSEKGVVLDTSAYLIILDEHGNDLLNPEKFYPKSVDLSQLSLVYVIDGKEQIASDGFFLAPPEVGYPNYRLGISLNATENEDPTTTLLKWSESQIDVMEASFHRAREGNFVVCTKVVLNGKVVWGGEATEKERNIEIIK